MQFRVAQAITGRPGRAPDTRISSTRTHAQMEHAAATRHMIGEAMGLITPRRLPRHAV